MKFDPQISFETIKGSRRQILTSVERPPVKVELFELGQDPYHGTIERLRTIQASIPPL